MWLGGFYLGSRTRAWPAPRGIFCAARHTEALDLIKKLPASERVEQLCVHHAFRYSVGWGETINGAPISQEPHRAYRESNGGMKSLIASVVTPDTFLYRKRAD
jgi:hypothetical protein